MKLISQDAKCDAQENEENDVQPEFADEQKRKKDPGYRYQIYMTEGQPCWKNHVPAEIDSQVKYNTYYCRHDQF